MSKTPTTDAKIICHEEEWSNGRGTYYHYYVEADYARKLEKALRLMLSVLSDQDNMSLRKEACFEAKNALTISD